MLASAVRGEPAAWPAEWRGSKAWAAVFSRIDYHGLSVILADRRDELSDWPAALADTIRQRATAAAVWEVRHRLLLDQLTRAMAAAGVETLILKGSALAYCLYFNPAARERGDSDLLVPPDQRAAARRLLSGMGLVPGPSDRLPETQRYQEPWIGRFDDGPAHCIDLHFDLFNTPVLAGAVAFATCNRARTPLPAIGPEAFAPGRAVLLYHACLHRAFNRVARYYAGGRETTGGDRLIWLADIDLLARALTDGEWSDFVELAIGTRQAKACLEGLASAQAWLGTPSPRAVQAGLAAEHKRSNPYLDRNQVGRALADMAAVRGPGPKLRYAWARLVPGAQFLRAKYPDSEDRPAAQLLMRRMIEAVSRSAGVGKG